MSLDSIFHALIPAFSFFIVFTILGGLSAGIVMGIIVFIIWMFLQQDTENPK